MTSLRYFLTTIACGVKRVHAGLRYGDLRNCHIKLKLAHGLVSLAVSGSGQALRDSRGGGVNSRGTGAGSGPRNILPGPNGIWHVLCSTWGIEVPP